MKNVALALSTVAFIVSLPTTVLAADLYECVRETYSTRGFSTGAAESWFPRNVEYIVADDKKWSALAHVGVDPKRSANERKFGVSNIPNGSVSVKVREVWKQSDLTSGATYLAILITLRSPGKVDTDPAHYRCSKPKKTKWVPQED